MPKFTLRVCREALSLRACREVTSRLTESVPSAMFRTGLTVMEGLARRKVQQSSFGWQVGD